jgi:hypothetical protein
MKQPGEPARLTYDTTAHVLPGDIIQTTTGRRYLVETSRVIRRYSGPARLAGVELDRPVRRWALATVVLPADHQLDEDDVVHELHWYARGRRRT